MLTELGYHGLFGYYLKKTPCRFAPADCEEIGDLVPFDVFHPVPYAEWDNLFFLKRGPFIAAGHAASTATHLRVSARSF